MQVFIKLWYCPGLAPWQWPGLAPCHCSGHPSFSFYCIKARQCQDLFLYSLFIIKQKQKVTLLKLYVSIFNAPKKGASFWNLWDHFFFESKVITLKLYVSLYFGVQKIAVYRYFAINTADHFFAQVRLTNLRAPHFWQYLSLFWCWNIIVVSNISIGKYFINITYILLYILYTNLSLAIFQKFL